MKVGLSVPETGVFNPNPSDGWEVVEGNPTMKTWFEFKTSDSTIVTGTWHATPGTWRVTTKYHEFIVMIEGVMEITEDGGEPVRVKAGDAFTVEANFSGTWKIIEPVHKRLCVRLA